MVAEATRFDKIAKLFDANAFKRLNEEMEFSDYLNKVYADPMLAISAYGRVYEMAISEGVEKFKRFRKTITKYNFFHNEKQNDCIIGLEEPLETLVKAFRGAAGQFGTEKRILLLHGPVGSAKSTLCRVIKSGLERYTQTEKGAVYTYKWKNLPSDLELSTEVACPTNADPLKLIPYDIRVNSIQKELNELLNARFEEDKARAKANKKELIDDILVHKINLGGNLNPLCQYYMKDLLKRYKGDWAKVMHEHITITRMVFSEGDRKGIGTFQPKDEKNQDATELTGDINYMKLSRYGVDSDPRSFSFDGEFMASNRGVMEWIEVLKLDKAFLYDLLGAAQERQVKPKKFAQVDIDVALLSHTNNPEFQKLKGDQTMEALRDRIYQINIPYLLRLSDEIKVLEKDYGPGKVRQHVAPHTLEIAAFWAILTRLKEDKKHKVPLSEKVDLYNGQMIEGWTEDKVFELLMDSSEGDSAEGLFGVSARYIQNKISNCLVSNHNYINPFMVLNELEQGLETYTLLQGAEDKDRYRQLISVAKSKLEEILKDEVQRALVADPDAIQNLFTNYIDHMYAFINKAKIQDPFTGDDVDPDENLMRSIETKVDIAEQMAPEFRRSIAAMLGEHARRAEKAQKAGDPNWEAQKFDWRSNARLRKALEKKMFEETKHHIKLSTLNSNAASVADPEIQKKIDLVKTRLVNNFGYNDHSATDVLNYVSSIHARGEKIDG